jgi:cytochrome o ubiquinol oxidase operon protein cyoD
MSKNTYFEQAGMWPHNAPQLERTYMIGFALSILLTLGAYFVVVHHLVPASVAVPLVLIFACLQFLVQVLNFLHVNGEPSSRERLVALFCTSVIMLILVLGSMWIMTNLNTRMNPQPQQMETYMTHQQGI